MEIRYPAQPDKYAPLAIYLNPEWVTWVRSLLYANLALHEGNLSGVDGSALAHLDAAEAAASSLPLWATSVVHVCRSQVLVRESRHREAVFWIRRVYTAARQGYAHPAARSGAQLLRAKMRYDQARYAEAEHFLSSPLKTEGMTCPNWLNMTALLTGRQFVRSTGAESTHLLAQTFSRLAEALGHVFIGYGDTSLLNTLSYNFSTNLLQGIRHELFPKSCTDIALQWLATNKLVCKKLGVGDDSVLADLLLIDIGWEFGCAVETWPELLRCGQNAKGNLNGVLERALAQARRMGNRQEIAHCLWRQMRLAPSAELGRGAYLEAAEIYESLNRKDSSIQLAAEWKARF